MPGLPTDATDLTHLLVVADLDRPVAWYRDVLGTGPTSSARLTSRLRKA